MKTKKITCPCCGYEIDQTDKQYIKKAKEHVKTTGHDMSLLIK